MPDKPFVIVGAGMGGLATAVLLAHEGCRVIVLEKTGQVGGRNRLVKVGECDFDGGPTLLMMLEPFRRLFRSVGESFDENLSPTLCDPSYKAFFSDGTGIEATTNRSEMVAQLAALSGQADAEAFPRLLADLAKLYEAAIPNFVERNFYRPIDFFGPKSLALVRKHCMLGNLAKRIAQYFQDERLRMLFSFQTMYLGMSPYDAPWVYAVLTHMEYAQGIWYPEGGIHRIAEVLAELARARGAEICLDAEVISIEGSRVTLKDGMSIEAKAVIVNADLPYAERELLGFPHKKRRSSCSAYVMTIDYEGSLPALGHHNVFFGSDFKGNLDALFHRLEIPGDPAFYAAISARTDPSKAPHGHENLYILVPCPNLDRPFSEEDSRALEQSAFQRLAREAGFDPANIVQAESFGPNEWQRGYNLDRGAAFGISHDFLQSAYFRPSNRSKTNPSVYFVGASTAPGNGLPMVVISAELVKERLAHDGFLTS